MNAKLLRITLLISILLSLNFSVTYAELPNSVNDKPLPSLAPMLERTTPSVVNISTTGKVVVRYQS